MTVIFIIFAVFSIPSEADVYSESFENDKKAHVNSQKLSEWAAQSPSNCPLAAGERFSTEYYDNHFADCKGFFKKSTHWCTGENMQSFEQTLQVAKSKFSSELANRDQAGDACADPEKKNLFRQVSNRFDKLEEDCGAYYSAGMATCSKAQSINRFGANLVNQLERCSQNRATYLAELKDFHKATAQAQQKIVKHYQAMKTARAQWKSFYRGLGSCLQN